MERENILVILYEMALAIGGETRLTPLLTRTLQRLLYHTSFPTGFVCLDLPPPAPGEETVEARLDAVVGDYELMGLAEQPVRLPAALLRGAAKRAEDAALLARLPGTSGRYRAFLRLPLDGHGTIVLLAPRMPATDLPLTSLFQPVMANLAKAIVLCRHHEAYTAGLAAERDTALEALKREQKLFIAGPTVVFRWVAKENWPVEYVSPNVTQFGYSADDFTSGRILYVGVVHPEDLERVAREVKTHSESGVDHFTQTYRIVRADGEARWIEDYTIVVRNDEGEITHYDGYVVDITERQRAEEALRHSEDSLKEAQRIAHIGNWDLDLARNVLTWSDEIFRMFEIDPAKFGASYEAFLAAIHPDDRETVNRAYTEHVKHRVPYDIVHRLRMPDGRVKHVHEKCETTYDEAGRPLRSLGTVQDITERVLAERRLRESLERAVEAIAATIEMRDPYTAGHERRVLELAVAIGRELELTGERIEGLRFAALIHDIGKIHIPAEILSKPAKLSPIEFELIKTHCQVGYDILKGIEFPWPVARIVLEHHEHLDGSGYPNGLRGDALLLESKILAVADVVEAMASHRPYRPALGIDAALAEIEHRRGEWYDPTVTDACLRLFRERGFRFG